MPKFAVALVSGALAGMVGFILGALFTVPQNKEMEELVRVRAEMVQQLQELENKNRLLISSATQYERQIRDLKDRLLRAYEIEKEIQKASKSGG